MKYRGTISDYDQHTGEGEFHLMTEYRLAFTVAFTRAKPGQIWNLDLSPWQPHRTTGPFSQNHHYNGHCQQIAMYTGNDMETVRDVCKWQAVAMDYPLVRLGKQSIPKRESDSTTVECALLIEASHLLGSELGIKLREE